MAQRWIDQLRALPVSGTREICRLMGYPGLDRGQRRATHG